MISVRPHHLDDPLSQKIDAFSRRSLLLATACLVGCRPIAAIAAQSATPVSDLANPNPLPAEDAILAAFDQYQLVGLSDAHWLRQEHEFLEQFVRHPQFASVVDTVVVEFGNARYQDVIDRYLAGEDVPRDELVRVWRDTTQLMAWDSPVYEQFFATVREINRNLPVDERLRVLLGDPPIDWDQIQTAEDYTRFYDEMGGRAPHYAEVVLTEVLANGQKALLIAGSFHLVRIPNVPNEAARIDTAHPGTLFTLAVHLEAGDQTDEIEEVLAGGPIPSVSLLDGTWLGALPGAEGVMADEFDAYLYLGPCRSLMTEPAIPESYQDEEYLTELQRRHAILTEVGAMEGALPVTAYVSGGPYTSCPS